MNPRDFQIKQGGKLVDAGGVPIVGQEPPAVVRDQLGRELRSGDYCVLFTQSPQPFRVVSVTKVPRERLPPGAQPMMEIRFESVAVFHSACNVPNTEFLRHLSREESDALKARMRGAPKPEEEKPAEEIVPEGGASPIEPPPGEPA